MAASKEMGCKLLAVVVEVRWQQPEVASMRVWGDGGDQSVGRSEGDSICHCMVHVLFRSVRTLVLLVVEVVEEVAIYMRVCEVTAMCLSVKKTAKFAHFIYLGVPK